MKTIIASICLVLIFAIKSCSSTSDYNLQKSRERGYADGVIKGKNEAETVFSRKLEQQKNDYEALLLQKKNELEQKVKDTYHEGVQKGIQKMTEEINSAVTIKTDNKKSKRKKSKQNWN